MKKLIILTFLFFPVLLYGQTSKLIDAQVNASGASRLTFIDSLSQATELAKADLAKNLPFLLLRGGIVHIIYPDDAKFEKAFQVSFFDSGCTGPSYKFAVEYNRVMFEYLNLKYGKKWMRKIRKDVIGLKEFKENN